MAGTKQCSFPSIVAGSVDGTVQHKQFLMWCRLASKTDMLERLYTCLRALQAQYEVTQQQAVHADQNAKDALVQLALTGTALLLPACIVWYSVPIWVQVYPLHILHAVHATCRLLLH